MAATDKISPGQLRALWASARDQGYDEEGLRDLVQARFGGRSISGLSGRQASELLKILGRKSRPARPAPDHGRAPAEAMLRKIQALWGELGRRNWYQPEHRDAALNEFLRRRFGISHPRFLDVSRARKVIEALKAILAREEGKP